ncbi:hypothetical protein QTO34_010312 [Cnephaeus nilssonii]|uniref:UPAR/Ly6 domain-containing protein n=1 Tax=Cnephaeus nilssonii TaxID=3371016 RepID=A0AA40HG85_CNENI|nr:hypothetical protein QTO34_010312 [Eptesicus nilssonii]
MNSILPALLGLTLMLPREQALICQSGRLQTVRETTELPLEWTAGEESCMDGWGCQDSLMLIENVDSKDSLPSCQELSPPQQEQALRTPSAPNSHQGLYPEGGSRGPVTQHRKGPGLSVVSYTHVCRHKNLCNDLSTSFPVWTLPTSAVPGSVRCPVCFAEEGCKSATELTCPVGHTHCYNGTLQLRGVGVLTDLQVQGCMSQAACNLLNETREIGALSVNEKCDSVGEQALICQSGRLQIVRETSELPLEWTAGEEFCMDGWGCQDSLMLIENGPQVLLILIKGCTQKEDHEARVTQHRKGPGLSVVSYTRVCRHKNLCNDLSTSLPVWTLPTSAVPGSVRCPVCFAEEGCKSATELTCPVGHTHCYNGILQLRGVGIFSDLQVQGCMSQAACNLFNETREIGALSVNEKCDSVARLTCENGVMFQMEENLAQNPLPWETFSTMTCDLNEVCQETLLLIDVGPKSLMVGSKGCSKTETQNSKTVSIHSAPPGVLVASYAHFCSSNGCNRATK